MDCPDNLVALCLECHAPLLNYPFLPSTDRGKLYGQLRKFKELASTWTGKKRRNMFQIFPRHLHGMRGDTLFAEVREAVAAWEHLRGRSFFVGRVLSA